ncbi:ABC transporter ATP-binding protein [Balneatrix alpica]|uniref:ABC transporter ATP-binding protein n=1 Tax=Balneatrix alpica TaxID=75684 RepID=A0ABV5ZEP3_9GAMM|nr:ABC transporter ATP-binding protein [Balneatrix alpica]
MTTLEVSQLSFAYGGKRVLQEVSFSLQSGGFYALLGVNGAGKTTLFNLLTRLLALQQGRIHFPQASRQTQAEVLRQLGVVFQQSTLDLDLTVQQNLSYHAALQGLSRAEGQRRIEQELERMQMLPRLHERVRELNGGHRRRLEIARALLHQPSILLLDEASAGMDVQSRQRLLQHVHQLCAERGISVLWATHLLEEVSSEDQLLWLHQGRLLEQGQVAQICQRQQQPDLPSLVQHWLAQTGEC